MQITKETLPEVFQYHAYTPNQIARSAQIRGLAAQLADVILENSKEGRERSLALTKLQEVVMWANAGIALNEIKKVPDKD